MWWTSTVQNGWQKGAINIFIELLQKVLIYHLWFSKQAGETDILI